MPQRLGVTTRGRSRRLQRVQTDFGCEDSFARAADRVLEHYGLALGSTAVRTATLTHAHRARVDLEAEYAQPFRVLLAVGAQHVITETDGTMICTVAPGPRKSKRPGDWEEMRQLQRKPRTVRRRSTELGRNKVFPQTGRQASLW